MRKLESKYRIEYNRTHKKNYWHSIDSVVYGNKRIFTSWDVKPTTKEVRYAVSKLINYYSWKKNTRTRLVLVEKTRV